MQETLDGNRIEELATERHALFDRMMKHLKIAETPILKVGIIDEYLEQVKPIDEEIRKIHVKIKDNQAYINPIETELERKKRILKSHKTMSRKPYKTIKLNHNIN